MAIHFTTGQQSRISFERAMFKHLQLTNEMPQRAVPSSSLFSPFTNDLPSPIITAVKTYNIPGWMKQQFNCRIISYNWSGLPPTDVSRRFKVTPLSRHNLYQEPLCNTFTHIDRLFHFCKSRVEHACITIVIGLYANTCKILTLESNLDWMKQRLWLQCSSGTGKSLIALYKEFVAPFSLCSPIWHLQLTVTHVGIAENTKFSIIYLSIYFSFNILGGAMEIPIQKLASFGLQITKETFLKFKFYYELWNHFWMC